MVMFWIFRLSSFLGIQTGCIKLDSKNMKNQSMKPWLVMVLIILGNALLKLKNLIIHMAIGSAAVNANSIFAKTV
jgi:hypothetical protein